MYDFSFVEGLSKLQEVMKNKTPTLMSIALLRDTLREEYCLESDFEEERYNMLQLKVPKEYSDIMVEWIQECYKYYTPAPVGITIVKGDLL